MKHLFITLVVSALGISFLFSLTLLSFMMLFKKRSPEVASDKSSGGRESGRADPVKDKECKEGEENLFDSSPVVSSRRMERWDL